MDSQDPECNLHVESQRNASLENELFEVPLNNCLTKMGCQNPECNLHVKVENSLDSFKEKYHCKFSEKKHSLKGLYNEFIYNKIDNEDYKVYLENMWEEIYQRTSEEVFPNWKYQLNLLVEFSKSTPNDEQFITCWFNSGEFISTAKSFIDEQAYKKLTDTVIEKV